ncbi:hypothetical protein ACTXG7_05275 [Mycolicibacterium sp. Dal123E01]|uniref:hypothetical protein n=1 Tax=Mycolicibacterium sp. Dal123E01 TaxID=3457578 RepID=UPI00403EF6F9
MTDLTTAELVATVASAAVKATLVAAGSTLSTPKTPTAARPGHNPLSTATPVAPPRRALTAADLAVCVHEAGHAVAGVVLGGELRDALVFDLRHDGLRGLTRFHDCPDHLKTRVAYGGPWSEAKFQAGGRRPSQRELFAAMDGHGCRDQRALNAAGGTHEGASVQPIIDRTWPAILTVARQLRRLGEVHSEDVLKALGVRDGGGLTSTDLAEIRSGNRSVPPFNAKTPQPA